MDAHEKGNDLETEKVKNERIKLKLEALKQGYELTDDGELRKIEKVPPKKSQQK